MEQDPAGAAGSGANFYWFCQSNPTNAVDPTGNKPSNALNLSANLDDYHPGKSTIADFVWFDTQLYNLKLYLFSVFYPKMPIMSTAWKPFRPLLYPTPFAPDVSNGIDASPNLRPA